jgi:hypothetical protein
MGSTFNNVIIMVWTEGVAAQNFTLDFDWNEFNKGAIVMPPDFRDVGSELTLCQRYLEPIFEVGNPSLFRWYGPGSAGEISHCFSFKQTKRVAPTIINATPSYINNCSAGFAEITKESYRINMLSSTPGVGSFAWLTATPFATSEL